MATGTLTIDLAAICANWRAMDRLSHVTTETAAVVKADAYGLGAGTVARALAGAGAQRFFVAVAEEGVAVRQALGEGFEINILGGHCNGDTALLRDYALTPMLNSVEQVTRHFESLPGHNFGIQLDTGMNRLGLEADDWAAIADIVLDARPTLLMSHLACADDPGNPLNASQLATFHTLTDGLGIPRSLSATGGILLGPEYHFDLTRPGVGLYGGLPFEGGMPVVQLALPVIQHRLVQPGEYVGYSMGFRANKPTRVATLSAGYADGLARALSGKATLWAGDVPCPLLGRVSMDLITVDVSHLDQVPDTLDILGPHQGVDALGAVASTIGYEILTSLGRRYARQYLAEA